MIEFKEYQPVKTPISPGALALGRYVRKWRIENRYSQRGFGVLVGKKQVTIGEIERGENHVTMEMVMALSRAMGKDPLDLAAVYFMSESAKVSRDIAHRLNGNARETSEKECKINPIG